MTKVDSIVSNYDLPTASNITKGGIKVGDGLRMTGDILSVVEIPDATSLASGLMTASDKIKLDDLNNYTLPTASGSVKGGVKIGSGLKMTGEVLSADLSAATSTSGDLMSAEDKRKLVSSASESKVELKSAADWVRGL